MLHPSTICHSLLQKSTKMRDCWSSDGVFAADGEQTACERHREAAQASSSSSGGYFFYRPRPAVGQYVPSCDAYGAYEPLQCHASVGQCWCVDSSGQEIPGSRAEPGSRPMCKSTDILINLWFLFWYFVASSHLESYKVSTLRCVVEYAYSIYITIVLQYYNLLFFIIIYLYIFNFCIYLFRFCHIWTFFNF